MNFNIIFSFFILINSYKYFNNIYKFEEDVTRKLEVTRKFKENIKRLILEDPNLIEQRYFNTIEVLKELKEEFGI